MRTLLVGLLSLSFLCANSRAQTSLPTTLDPATLAAEAIAAFSAAPIAGVQLSGTAHAIAGSTDETGTFTFTLQSTGESTLTLNLNALTRTETTGNLSSVPQCIWSGADGVQHPAADHNCRVALNWVLPVLSLRARLPQFRLALAEQGASANTLAVSAIASARNGKTGALLERLSRARLAIDASTLAPDSLSFDAHPDKNLNVNIAILVRYSDYRRVNGVFIPFQIKKFVNNGLTLELDVENASVQAGGAQ